VVAPTAAPAVAPAPLSSFTPAQRAVILSAIAAQRAAQARDEAKAAGQAPPPRPARRRKERPA
jgi:hypothetical protein